LGWFSRFLEKKGLYPHTSKMNGSFSSKVWSKAKWEEYYKKMEIHESLDPTMIRFMNRLNVVKIIS